MSEENTRTYTNILTVRDKNGNQYEIPVIRGPQGPAGPQGPPGTLEATDQNTGDHIFFWIGTRAEYNAIPEDELIENCVYYITDDTRDDYSTRLTALEQSVANIQRNTENMWNTIYPIGSIYISIQNTSPESLFGGTWEQLGGRFLVGVGATTADNSNAAYGNYAAGSRVATAVNETGGELKHKLSKNEMPIHTHDQEAHTHTQNAHTHTQAAHEHNFKATDGNTYSSLYTWGNPAGLLHFGTESSNHGGSKYYCRADNTGWFIQGVGPATPSIYNTTAVNQNTTAVNKNTGGDFSHNNIPPYLAVYMWKRTA